MKRNLYIPLVCILFAILSCSRSGPTVCGIYSETTVNRVREGGQPAWIEAPGQRCAVGYAYWGNSSKEKAQIAAYTMAKENLVRSIAPETVKVESEMHIHKTRVNGKVGVTARGTSSLKSEGEEVRIKTKRRAVWFQGYNVWVLVERIP